MLVEKFVVPANELINVGLQAGLFQTYDHRGDGRLKAHKISKQLLVRLNGDTRKRAVEQLRETSKAKISELRQAAADYKNGQLHGFWTQQFANASHWLDEQKSLRNRAFHQIPI